MARKAKEAEETPLADFVQIWTGKVDIKRIDANIETQVRKNGVDQDVVKDYTKAIEDPLEDLPTAAVFTEAAKYNEKAHLLLADGFHRHEAYKVMGRQTIPVSVFRGGISEAKQYAIFVNSRHGKSFNHKDRVYAVKLLIEDAASKDWSVRKVAECANCSKSTVQNIKNPPKPNPSKTKATTPEPSAIEAGTMSVPADFQETAEINQGRFMAAAAPTSNGAPPAIVPAMVRQRQVSELATSEERLGTLRLWILQGEIERGDIMNIFASPDGRLVWVARQPNPQTKTLLIRHGDDILVDAQVTVNAELPAVIDVSVADPRTVEYAHLSTVPPMLSDGMIVDPFA